MVFCRFSKGYVTEQEQSEVQHDSISTKRPSETPQPQDLASLSPLGMMFSDKWNLTGIKYSSDLTHSLKLYLKAPWLQAVYWAFFACGTLA